jgi:hypothetical protein
MKRPDMTASEINDWANERNSSSEIGHAIFDLVFKRFDYDLSGERDPQKIFDAPYEDEEDIVLNAWNKANEYEDFLYWGESTYRRKIIAIISGEGEIGTVSRYTGKDSDIAIKSKLTRERCNGDRWAKAVIYSHKNNYGRIGTDFETGEYVELSSFARSINSNIFLIAAWSPSLADA